MDSLEDLFEYTHALVFGVGGSGDVVSCLPTAQLLEQFDTKVTLGGMSWEPVPYDSQPGPRSINAVENIDQLNETVGLASGDTRTKDGLIFTESIVADYYDQNVLLIGMDNGVEGMVNNLEDACKQLDIDLVIGVDAGGDAIARGDEPGLRSPVTDGYGITTLSAVDIPATLGIFGYGSDGELTIEELEESMAHTASLNGLLGSWGMTRRTRQELESLLDVVDTEASRLPVEAASGDIGRRSIRGGEVKVNLRMPSTVTFYFRPEIVADRSRISEVVAGTETLDGAVDALREAGFRVEFDTERQRLENGS